MKSISKIWVVITVLLSSVNTFAQIKNTKTETVKIYGECDMCKATIEKAGNSKDVAKVEWNADTKQATLQYDAQKTSREEILKRIALVGYDSEDYLAPADVYNELPECCQYPRELGAEQDQKHDHSHVAHTAIIKNPVQLQGVFDRYFAVKDALVLTDEKAASSKAVDLLTAIKAVDMNKLSAEEHTVWMTVHRNLTENAENIAKSKPVAKQREIFTDLSEKIYALAKVAKLSSPIHYQHCPMANSGKGANWLSKDSGIKNPYFGSKMLTCGSTVETLD